MEPTGSRSVKDPGAGTLNLAIVYAMASAFTVGIGICMIGVELKKGSGFEISIWAVIVATSLINTFLGARRIRKAARRFQV
jgi:uncharacterized ion transporter superfamily protein YfcC